MRKINQHLKRTSLPFILAIGLLSLFTFCQKDSFITDGSAQLAFSEDTLMMDSVFVTIGSATNELVVYNRHDQKINISSIQLAGGANSQFRINIDGEPKISAENVEIWANDSLHIFVEYTIDPTDANTPFIVTDSILFETNGNLQDVDLVAWGQNANFYGRGAPNGEHICDEVWTNERPYVIYNALIVDSMCSLTIEEGTDVYLHNGAAFVVHGTLKVNGAVMDSSQMVTFQGTRLNTDFANQYYQRVPGQWFGILFSQSSTNNEVKGALIRNSVYGLYMDLALDLVPSMNPRLFVENTTIRDVALAGLVGINGDILATNTTIFNCGQNNVWLIGGEYAFLNCTFANYNVSGNFTENKDPIIRINNLIELGQEQGIALGLGGAVALQLSVNRTQFINCVVLSGDDEAIGLQPDDRTLADIESGNAIFEQRFDHCFVKTEIGQDSLIFENCLFTQELRDTTFMDYSGRDLRLKPFSKAINAGQTGANISRGSIQAFPQTDALGHMRDDQWDIGSYEL